MYRVMEGLYAPQKPTEKSFQEIKLMLQEFFKPKHFMFAEVTGFTIPSKKRVGLFQISSLVIMWIWDIFKKSVIW